MPVPDLYSRVFTMDELMRLAHAVAFMQRMLDLADFPRSTLDELDALMIRLLGTDLPADVTL